MVGSAPGPLASVPHPATPPARSTGQRNALQDQPLVAGTRWRRRRPNRRPQFPGQHLEQPAQVVTGPLRRWAARSGRCRPSGGSRSGARSRCRGTPSRASTSLPDGDDVGRDDGARACPDPGVVPVGQGLAYCPGREPVHRSPRKPSGSANSTTGTTARAPAPAFRTCPEHRRSLPSGAWSCLEIGATDSELVGQPGTGQVFHLVHQRHLFPCCWLRLRGASGALGRPERRCAAARERRQDGPRRHRVLGWSSGRAGEDTPVIVRPFPVPRPGRCRTGSCSTAGPRDRARRASGSPAAGPRSA